MSNESLNADSQLEYTQEIRRKVVASLLPAGDENPATLADPKMLNLLLSTLKDHDKVTLTLKRMDNESENADADRAVLAQFHKLSAMTGSKDLTRLETPAADYAGPAFNPDEIPTTALVEGELGVGTEAIDFDKFMLEQSKKHQESLA